MCRRRWTALAASVTALVCVAPALAWSSAVTADSGEYAQPVMNLSMSTFLTMTQARSIVTAVNSSGASAYAISNPFIGMSAHLRGEKYLTRMGKGWRIPMSTLVAPVDYMKAIAGSKVAGVLRRGEIAMGETSASLRGAKVGDKLLLRDGRYAPHWFTIGAIVPQAYVDWGDMAMSPQAVARLGSTSITRISIVDIPSPEKVFRFLARKGIVPGTTYRLTRSWDPPNPDGTLGTSTLKKMLGEFSYRPTVGASIYVDPTYTARIEWRHHYDDIAIGHSCHRTLIPLIQGALTEIRKAGLAKAIDLRSSNRYGGCFVGRYNRRGGFFGAPSRHAWGAAFDINTVTNAQGAVPQMNCKVVRIMRKWGFAWGGNFWPADGMHFEYVGEPRDTWGYKSTYCPNLAKVPVVTRPHFRDDPPRTTTTTSTTTSTTSTSTTVPEPSTTTTSTSTTTTTTTTSSSTTTTTVAPGP